MISANDAHKAATKHKKAVDALKQAAYALTDIQFEAERACWERSSEEMRSLSTDCFMVVSDLAMEYAASWSSRRAVRFEIRQTHRDMHPKVLALVTKLAADLDDIESSDYPGGPKAARLHEISGRISGMVQDPARWPVADIEAILGRAEERKSELLKSTKAHMVTLRKHLETRQ